MIQNMKNEFEGVLILVKKHTFACRWANFIVAVGELVILLVPPVSSVLAEMELWLVDTGHTYKIARKTYENRS